MAHAELARPVGFEVKPVFDPKNFVGRTAELHRLMTLINSTLIRYDLRLTGEEPDSTNPQQAQIIVVTGEAGIGKTWLLQKLANRVASEWRRFSKVQDGIQNIIGYIDTAKLSTPTAEAIRELGIPGGINQHVLIIDHVFDRGLEFFITFTIAVLTPIMKDPNRVIIIAGRGNQDAHPFRLWQMSQVVVIPPPFSLEETQLQLRQHYGWKAVFKRIPTAAALVHARSGGNPWANYLLAQSPQHTVDADVITALSLSLPENTRKVAMETLEAFCVLPDLKKSDIGPLLVAYYGKDLPKSLPKIRLKLLVNRGLAYAGQEDMYILDPTYRELIKEYMKRKRTRIWNRLDEVTKALRGTS